MKLWEKIFICTLIVFEVFFVPTSIYLINSNFKSNLKIQVNSGISEEHNLCSFIESEIYLLKVNGRLANYTETLSKDYMNSMVKVYLNNYLNVDTYVQVVDENNEVVFNNFGGKFPSKRNELDAASDKISYIIRDVDKKTYLFAAKKISLENSPYKVSYIKDITGIYDNRKYLFDILIKLNIFVSVILIILMIILSKLIVNPINKLIESTHKIAEGNFTERVKVISDDEIGTLSEDFNTMADVIEDKMNELKKNSEDKERFTDNLTHELRTPLTSIIGYADFLRTHDCDEETRLSSLSYIYDEGKRLEKLSSSLMNLIVLRKEDFEMRDESIKELLNEVKNSLTPKLESKNVVLEISSDDLSFYVNKELIRILVTNLIDNAIKASKTGDKICLNVYKDEKDHILLKVKDMGVGIPKEDIPKITEPFYMVDKSRERANNGVGLGLSLCVQIAKIHNAQIHIESELGRGTVIRVIFLNDRM